MGKMLVIKAAGTLSEVNAPDIWSGQSEFSSKLEEIVCGGIEIVWVQHENKRVCMIVNDIGAITNMPVNKVATEIYWGYTNSMSDESIESWWDTKAHPRIHGDVALLTGVNVT